MDMILYNASSSYYSMIGRYALIEANVPFDNRIMDIHLAKEQLSDEYMKINPAMTVPTLVDKNKVYLDSQDILKYAAMQAGDKWMDNHPDCAVLIDPIVKEHYSISIERLTFGKALSSIPFLKFLVFKMLDKAIKTLETQLPNSENRGAIEAKIHINKQRLAYFEEANLKEKLQIERNKVQVFLNKLPHPPLFLFGNRISSADIVTVVLLSRLKMIGEFQLVQLPDLRDWYNRMKLSPEFKKADIWTYFQPWRIVLKN